MNDLEPLLFASTHEWVKVGEDGYRGVGAELVRGCGTRVGVGALERGDVAAVLQGRWGLDQASFMRGGAVQIRNGGVLLRMQQIGEQSPWPRPSWVEETGWRRPDDRAGAMRHGR